MAAGPFFLATLVLQPSEHGSAQSQSAKRAQRAEAKQAFLDIPRKPLAHEHKAFDDARHCPECHVGYSRPIDDNKCLNCHDHKNLRARIRAGEGFHSSSQVKGRRCASCHRDNEGRSYNIMGWSALRGGERGFDHQLAGWPLTGRHAKAVCKDCHPNRNRGGRRTFLGESKDCSRCHEPRDRFVLTPPQCSNCHGSGR